MAITALVIAAVIILNVIFSILASANGWFIDLTTESIYTLSDTCVELLDSTFCSYSVFVGGSIDHVPNLTQKGKRI